MNAQAAGIRGGGRAAPRGQGEVEKPRNPAGRRGRGSRGAAGGFTAPGPLRAGPFPPWLEVLWKLRKQKSSQG